MDDEQGPARTDTLGEPASRPTLAPVRRRGESHLLALMLAAAAVFVAMAIAKPWGEGAPPPRAFAATPSLASEIAKSSTESAPPPEASAATPSPVAEMPQQVFIVLQPEDVPVTFTVVCTEDARVSPSVVGSAEPVMGLGCGARDLVCTGANLQGLESVLPSPSVP